MGGGWNWVMYMSSSTLATISIELTGYAPILPCTQVHAACVAVRLNSISLPHWLNLYVSYCIFTQKQQWNVHMLTVEYQ